MKTTPRIVPAAAVCLLSTLWACGTNPATGLDVEVGLDATTGTDADAGDDASDAIADNGGTDVALDTGPDVEAPDTRPDADIGTDAPSDAGGDTAPDADVADSGPVEPTLWPASCDSAVTRSIVDRPRWNDPAVLGFTPDGGQIWLVHHGDWEGTAARGRDGMLLARPSSSGVVSFDARWERAAQVRIDDVTELVVFETSSLEEIFVATIGNSLDGSRAAAALRPDGEEVAWATCSAQSDERGELFVTRAALPADGEQLEVSVPVAASSCYSYDDRTLLRWVGDALWFVAAGAGEAWVMGPDGTLAGPHRLVDGPLVPETGVAPEIVEIVVEPDETSLLVASSSGEVQRWLLPGPIEGDVVTTTATGVLNEFTFAPKVRVAPIAVSPDGTLTAWASGRDVVAVGDADGRVIAEFEIPIVADEFGAPAESDRISGITFSSSGDLLAVAHTGGLELIGCPPEPGGNAPESIDVTVQGRARVGQPVTLRAVVRGGGPWTLLSAAAEGYRLPTRLFEQTVQWSPSTAGRVEVQVSASDSAGQVTQTITVDVAP